MGLMQRISSFFSLADQTNKAHAEARAARKRAREIERELNEEIELLRDRVRQYEVTSESTRLREDDRDRLIESLKRDIERLEGTIRINEDHIKQLATVVTRDRERVKLEVKTAMAKRKRLEETLGEE